MEFSNAFQVTANAGQHLSNLPNKHGSYSVNYHSFPYAAVSEPAGQQYSLHRIVCRSHSPLRQFVCRFLSYFQPTADCELQFTLLRVAVDRGRQLARYLWQWPYRACSTKRRFHQHYFHLACNYTFYFFSPIYTLAKRRVKSVKYSMETQ